MTFEEDSDEEIDTIEIEEENWIEYMKRSIVDALDKMERGKIRCWNSPQKMKWKLALRIAILLCERWLKKAAEWNPDLSSRYKTNRAIGRPRKRWEDDINDFLKQVLEEKENEGPIESSNQTNNNWINIAKDWRRWAKSFVMVDEQGSRTMRRVLNKDEVIVYEFLVPKREKIGCEIRYDCCAVVSCRPSSPGVVAFPGSLGRSSPLGFLWDFSECVIVIVGDGVTSCGDTELNNGGSNLITAVSALASEVVIQNAAGRPVVPSVLSGARGTTALAVDCH